MSRHERETPATERAERIQFNSISSRSPPESRKSCETRIKVMDSLLFFPPQSFKTFSGLRSGHTTHTGGSPITHTPTPTVTPQFGGGANFLSYPILLPSFFLTSQETQVKSDRRTGHFFFRYREHVDMLCAPGRARREGRHTGQVCNG